MLDQNTDRMWYVIGAVIIGAAIILILNGTAPELFASVADTFKGKTDEVTGVVDGIGSPDPFDETFVATGTTKQSATPSYDAPVDFVHTTTINVNGETITLDEPLRSTGSAADRMFLDAKDGKWKIERNVKEMAYVDGREMTTNGVVYFNRASDKAYATPYRTTHFAGSGEKPWQLALPNSNELIETVQGDLSYAILIGIHPDTTLFPTIELFNQWLEDQAANGTPLKVMYELRNPTYEVLSEALQSELNSHLIK